MLEDDISKCSFSRTAKVTVCLNSLVLSLPRFFANKSLDSIIHPYISRLVILYVSIIRITDLFIFADLLQLPKHIRIYARRTPTYSWNIPRHPQTPRWKEILHKLLGWGSGDMFQGSGGKVFYHKNPIPALESHWGLQSHPHNRIPSG